MAKTIQLKAEPRANSCTTASKAARKAGKVPATIYGRHQKAQSLQLDARALSLALAKSTGEHILVNLEIAGGTSTLALIQDVQHHALKRHILHLDFHALKEDEKMHTTVPVTGFGEPAGVKTGGGLLEQIIRALDVECLPKDLPDSIVVDVSALNIGDTIHVSDVALPEGVHARNPADAVVFHCAAPNVEVEVAPAAEGATAEPEVLKEKKPAEGEAAAGDAKGGDKKGDAKKPEKK
jgi:large subunit ribosomal protein L25